MVDAADDEVRLARADLEQAEVDAVGGRAVDGEPARLDLLAAQRAVERERVAGGRALAIGRDDDEVAEIGEAAGRARGCPVERMPSSLASMMSGRVTRGS